MAVRERASAWARMAATTPGERCQEFVLGEVEQQPAHVVVEADRVEADVDRADPRRVLLDRALGERVHFGDIGRVDLPGHCVQGIGGTAGQVDGGALAYEGACDGGSDGAARAVDHGALLS